MQSLQSKICMRSIIIQTHSEKKSSFPFRRSRYGSVVHLTAIALIYSVASAFAGTKARSDYVGTTDCPN